MCRNRLEWGGAAGFDSGTRMFQPNAMCSFSSGLDQFLHCQNVKNVNIWAVALLQAPEKSSVGNLYAPPVVSCVYLPAI